MWKKEDESAQDQEHWLERERVAPTTTQKQRAVIGRSISIRGEVTGDEDLLIQGRVDGSVKLKRHSVTVGVDGVVKASISSKFVTVEGKVEGNLSAEEQIVLRSSASVQGDITSPRIIIEDGARFRGGVDMGEGEEKGKPSTRPAAKSKRERKSKDQEPEIITTPVENGAEVRESIEAV